MDFIFDQNTRSFSAVYPEYCADYDRYYSDDDEEEAARRARRRRRIRNAAIGAGAAAALAGGGLLYLRHKGHGNIGAGWSHLKDRTANKISGGAFDRARKQAFESKGRVADLERVGRDYQKLIKSQNSKINNLSGALEGTRNALTGQRDMYKNALSRAMGKIRTGHFSDDEMYY